MKFCYLLLCTVVGLSTVINGQTVNDLPASLGEGVKKERVNGFIVSGQTGTGRKATVPGFIVAGHTGTSSVAGKKPMTHSKPLVVDNRPLPAPSNREDLTYSKDIRPIFQASCFVCHGGNTQMGDLRLDTLEAALKGTKSHKVIVPSRSRQSSLVTAIAQVDEDSAMPPGKRAPLTSKQIGLIRAWIIQGAK